MTRELDITLTESDADRLWPTCVRALRGIPDAGTYHEQWEKRHPLGMYNISIEPLPRRFTAVLDCLEQLHGRPMTPGRAGGDLSTRLLDAHKVLLYAMREHLQDCADIARVLFPKTEATKKEQRLREIHRLLAPFGDEVERIVNRMKHHQGRLSYVEASNVMVTIPAYSVIGPIGGNTNGPDLAVHKKQTRGPKAFSFASDLRRLFCTVYAVGHHMAQFVERLHNQPPVGEAADNPPCPWAFDLAQRISRLLPFVFPDEIRPPVGDVEAGVDADNRRWIRIMVASSGRLLTFGQIPGGQMRIGITYQGDGVTRSFRVP